MGLYCTRGFTRGGLPLHGEYCRRAARERTHGDEGRPDRRGHARHRIATQGFRAGGRDYIRQHHSGAADQRQNRNPRVWELPPAPASRPHRSQSENRRQGRSAAEKNSILQAQQGIERLRQSFEVRRARGTLQLRLTLWIISGALGAINISLPPAKKTAAFSAPPSQPMTIPARTSFSAAKKTSSF